MTMGEPKPTASLSGLLLARKGAARPAMRRPSMFGSSGNLAVSQDDLGWNDMGYDVDPDPTTPMDYEHDTGYNPLAGAVPEVKPEVRQQQERIAEQLQVQSDAGFEALHSEDTSSAEDSSFEEEERPEVVVSMTPIVRLKPSIAEVAARQVVKAPKKRAAPGSKAKAAFTLRLDNDRHLKLRLACAVSNRSAQMIVTEALDAFLDSIPEIEQLAARVPGR
jgi:hypothetical protein